MSAAFTWSGFVIKYDGDDGWSTEYKDGYIGVTFDRDDEKKPWSAVIECGQLTGSGDGLSAQAALENARAEIVALVAEQAALLREYFKEP